MPAPSYRVLTFALNVARSRQAISQVPVGAKYTGVKVLECPAGAGVELAFGANAENIPAELNRSFDWVDNCGNPYGATEGLLLTNPLGAGTLVLFVAFESQFSIGA
jgi:hypothetical protein